MKIAPWGNQTLKFYEYTQNNSGGSFIINDNVDTVVTIQARSEDEANHRAEQIGIYFDGCESGRDCDCCGDRWVRWPDEVETPRTGIVYYDDGRIIRL